MGRRLRALAECGFGFAVEDFLAAAEVEDAFCESFALTGALPGCAEFGTGFFTEG
jgi:hypothetical protein